MSEDRTRSVAPRTLDPSARLRLIVFCGGQVSSHRVPRAGELVIGRGEDAHVRIDHVTVSRKHATIIVGDALTIVDHGSFNGTSIGGRKIASNTLVPLGIATIAELGETMVVLQVEGPDTVTGSRGLAAAAPPSPAQTSAGMQLLYRLIDNVAQSNITVIVRGETGAGKEVVAEEIHRRSLRAQKSLVKLNCAALPEHLLEGELFGYERGAFTGATAAKPGLIEVADGGTLFLDEVGELPLATQAKLLRVAESREVLRLGSLRPKSVDVRFVAATHRDLEDMVARGLFRQDLYYRLNGVSLAIPPLRERASEIPRLANEFIARFCRESNRPSLPISDAAMAVLAAYPWPGNVRELRNVIERAVVFCRTVAVAPEHLGLPLDRTSRPPPGIAAPHDLHFGSAAAFARPRSCRRLNRRRITVPRSHHRITIPRSRRSRCRRPRTIRLRRRGRAPSPSAPRFRQRSAPSSASASWPCSPSAEGTRRKLPRCSGSRGGRSCGASTSTPSLGRARPEPGRAQARCRAAAAS